MILKTLKSQKLRHCLKGDVIEIVGKPFECSFKGFTIEDDGEIIAVAGVMLSRPVSLFLNIAEGVEPTKYMRMAVCMMKVLKDLLRTIDAPVYARADDKVDTADRLIRRAGFEKVTDEVYRWTDKH